MGNSSTCVTPLNVRSTCAVLVSGDATLEMVGMQ